MAFRSKPTVLRCYWVDEANEHIYLKEEIHIGLFRCAFGDFGDMKHACGARRLLPLLEYGNMEVTHEFYAKIPRHFFFFSTQHLRCERHAIAAPFYGQRIEMNNLIKFKPQKILAFSGAKQSEAKRKMGHFKC